MEISNTKQLIKVGITAVINSLGAMIFAYALSLYLLKKKTGSTFSYCTSLFAGPIIGLLMSPIIGKVINNSHKQVAITSEVGLIITIIFFYSF